MEEACVSAVGGMEKNSPRAWFRALRVHFVPCNVLPAILGSVIAWARFDTFSLSGFLLVLAAVTVNYFGLAMLDDVFDFLNAVDTSLDGEKNPFSGGSGVLTSGALTPRQLLTAAVLCFLFVAVIGVYFVVTRGWMILLFGIVGLFSSVFYTMPPVKLCYRGVGELGLLINYGPTIGMGAFYVQTGVLAWEPFFISLVLGFMMWSMIIINEIPDYDEDRRGGKFNLVARFGKEAGIQLYCAGLMAAYGTILLAVLLGLSPLPILLGAASLPLALKSVRILRETYRDRRAMAPANLAMIQVHLLTSLGLILGYVLTGFPAGL